MSLLRGTNVTADSNSAEFVELDLTVLVFTCLMSAFGFFTGFLWSVFADVCWESVYYRGHSLSRAIRLFVLFCFFWPIGPSLYFWIFVLLIAPRAFSTPVLNPNGTVAASANVIIWTWFVCYRLRDFRRRKRAVPVIQRYLRGWLARKQIKCSQCQNQVFWRDTFRSSCQTSGCCHCRRRICNTCFTGNQLELDGMNEMKPALLDSEIVLANSLGTTVTPPGPEKKGEYLKRGSVDPWRCAHEECPDCDNLKRSYLFWFENLERQKVRPPKKKGNDLDGDDCHNFCCGKSELFNFRDCLTCGIVR